MSVALALLAGLCWAGSDYLVARAGRTERAITVVVTVGLVGFVLLLPVVLLSGDEPTSKDLALGLLAGLAGSAGFIAFIKGASAHEMGVVVPLSAVAGAVVAVIVGLAVGDRYGATGWLGIGTALIGIALVSRSHGSAQLHFGGHRYGITMGLLSGVFFGVLFSLLGLTSNESGLWPLLTMRLSVIPLVVIARRTGARLLPLPSARTIVLVASLSAVGGLVFFKLATQTGPLGVAAVITSMSPAGTVALARFVDHEHVSRTRLIGIVVVLLSIALLSANG